MRIVEDLEFKKQILTAIAQREFKERTGVHCSDLLYCLNKQILRRLNPKESTEHQVLLFSLGWATQRWLTGKSEDEETIVKDGIQVTRDCMNGNIPWELKATFQSSAKAIEENDSWLAQIKAQCFVTGQTVANLSRLEIMGNWRSVFGKKEEKGLPENQKPTLHAYRLEFTQEELIDNWTWLLSRAELFKDILKRRLDDPNEPLLPPPLALPIGHEWECDQCEYRKECLNN
jgi:hypothetical protein